MTLVIKDISLDYKLKKVTTSALKDISFKVRRGDFISIIGPSGCGKSTLLDVISGVLEPTNGSVKLNDSSIINKPGSVSYMQQEDLLFPWRKVVDNVIIPLEIRGVKKVESHKKALKYLALAGIEEKANIYPSALSGGMRQRVALIRTLMDDKEIILLDEPFGRLDALTKSKLQLWLLKMKAMFNCSMIMVTHDIEEAILLSDRILILSQAPGTIIDDIEVDLPRPRTKETIFDEKFKYLHKRCLKYFS